MRDLHLLDAYRQTGSEIVRRFGGIGDGGCGMFEVASPVDRAPMRVVASTGGGWDHVSVSRPTRCPHWSEMEYVKRLFFCDDETAMQLHVPLSQHVNHHPHCLHLWRPQHQDIPCPPAWMVGPKDEAV